MLIFMVLAFLLVVIKTGINWGKLVDGLFGIAEDHPLVHVAGSASEACENAHALAVLTEWDEFKALDFQSIYEKMLKPAFVFDGRNILDLEALRQIGFVTHGVGKV